MRPTQKSNRSRGRGGRKGGGGGGGGNSLNRVHDSAGPEGKVRGTPQQIIDKYLTLARDAQTAGDRVTAENFLQHAEHYQRILIQASGGADQSRRDGSPGTDDQQPDDGQPQQGGQSAQGSGQDDRDRAPRRPAAEPAAERPSAEIAGMAMIDSGPDSDDLLIEADELSVSQPRRNGDDRPPRRRRPAPQQAQDDAPEAAGTDDQEAPVDS